MTRLEKVIEEVKSVRTGPGRAWIFDENGNMREDVLVGDVIPLLEELKEYEIDTTDEEIEEFINDEETKGDNTYNWGANISNDLQIHSQEYDDEITMVIAVHLRGDIRANYSDYFAVKMRGFYEFYELESMFQHKDITNTLAADINLMSEGYSVYDYEHDDDFDLAMFARRYAEEEPLARLLRRADLVEVEHPYQDEFVLLRNISPTDVPRPSQP